MATSTPNYGLIKPGGSDAPDIPGLNPNWDKIDTELKKNETNIGLLQGKEIMSGAIAANVLHTMDVVFPIPYTSPPIVIVSRAGQNTVGVGVDLAFHNVTATGFKISIKAPVAGNVYMHWLAIPRS